MFLNNYPRLIALTIFISVWSFDNNSSYGEHTIENTSFGAFEFAIPAKWTRVKPDRDKTVTQLLLNGTVWNNSDGMIKVDVGKPTVPTALELATALAGKDGKVQQNPVAIDGLDGIKVETTSTDLSRPKFAIVVYREDKAYLIMAAQKQGMDVSGALEDIVKSWKWKKGD